MAMWIATWESRNFSFMAMGATKAKARDALLDGLEAHGRQYGLELEWYARQYDDWQEEINYARLRPGDCLRDGELIRVHEAAG